MELLNTLNDRLIELMNDRGIRPAPLARNADLNESAVRDILRGRSKNPGVVTLHKIAAVLGVATSELFEPSEQLPVLGWIEETDVVHLSGDASSPLYTIESPFRPGVLEGLWAVEVRTPAVSPCARQGDLILLEPNGDVDETKAGRVCVCRLEDGGNAIGLLSPGEKAGRYRLLPISVHAPPRIDVRITAAYPVLMPLPNFILRRQKHPTHAGPTGLQEGKSGYDPHR